MLECLVCVLSSFLWRVRGGLKFWGQKAPLNKIWYALFYGAAYCLLTKWDFNVWAVVSIATLVSYQAYGWGEYVSCVLGSGKVSERSDCSLVDDIVDNLKITCKGKVYKLTDYKKLFGFVGLSLRGLILTFVIGLALHSIPYMFTGLAMGFIYWLAGVIDRHIREDGKYGWYYAEWMYGLYMGIMLCVLC